MSDMLNPPIKRTSRFASDAAGCAQECPICQSDKLREFDPGHVPIILECTVCKKRFWGGK